MATRKISDSSVRRLSGYLRQLRELSAVSGRPVVSSRELATGSGTTAAQVRKDLSQFGTFGKRGSGYPVRELRDSIARILGVDRPWRVAVVGVGKIGSALLGYGDLRRRGFEVVAAFDSDPAKYGRDVHGVPVFPMRALGPEIAARGIELAILAVPAGAAAEVAERLSSAGIQGILSFAAAKVDVGPALVVRTMDVALELEGVTFALASTDSRQEES